MAKERLTKHNPTEPRMEIHKMYVPALDHFPKCVINTSKFRLVQEVLKENFMKRQLHLFKANVFDCSVKINNHAFSGTIMHNALLR